MRIIKFSLIFFIIVSPFLNFGQSNFTPYTLKSPEIASLESISHPEINESKGKPIISIPLYHIDTGTFKIPITLTYNVDGIKVENESSWVGNSWGLTHGGTIIRKKVKTTDEHLLHVFSYGPQIDPEGGPGCERIWHDGTQGWFNYANYATLEMNYFEINNGNMTNFNVQSDSRHDAPDVFNYELPNGKSGYFIFKNENLIINSGNELVSHTLDSNGNISKFTITDDSGNKFYFDDANFEIYGYNRAWLQTRSGLATSSYSHYTLMTTSSPKYPCGEQSQGDGIYYSSRDGALDAWTKPTSTSWFLTKIETSNNRLIEYNYVSVPHYAILNTRSGASEDASDFSSPGSNRHNNYNEFTDRVISSITWENGKVIFLRKNSFREDVLSPSNPISGNHRSQLKALDKIEIYDSHNMLIKDIVFNTSYNLSLDIENLVGDQLDYFGYIYKRLWLDSITLNSFSDKPLKYDFKYNSQKLPHRFSFEQDFWGFYNGNNPYSEPKSMIPYLWYYPDDPRSFTRPTNFSIFRRTNYIGNEIQTSVSSTYKSLYSDRNSSQDYNKAGSLEEIIYPTGGSIKYEYELNSFLVEDQILYGNGLRVNSITRINDDSEVSRTNYTYDNENGITSGSITKLPQNAYTMGYQIKYNSSISDADVFYGRVTKTIPENGSIVTKYLVPFKMETENALFSDYHDQNFYEISLDENSDYGLEHTGTTNDRNYPELRDNLNTYYATVFGKPTEQIIFNEAELPVKKIEYSYDVSKNAYLHYIVNDFAYQPINITNPKRLYQTFLGDFSLKNIVTTEVFSGNDVFTEKSFDYNSHNLISEIKTWNSEGQLFQTNYKYPFDLIGVEQSPYMQQLINANRLNESVVTKYFKGTAKLSENHIKFGNSVNTSNLLLPIEKFERKGIIDINIANTEDRKISIVKYDSKGNILEYKAEDNISVVYIWGYKEAYLIAKIENASYLQVMNQIPNLQNLSDFDDDRTIDVVNTNGTISKIGKEGDLREALRNLRISLPNSMITTYTHDPLIGVTSITDSRGYTSYYEFDDFNRLERIKDQDGNIIKEYSYNYINVEINDGEDPSDPPFYETYSVALVPASYSGPIPPFTGASSICHTGSVFTKTLSLDTSSPISGSQITINGEPATSSVVVDNWGANYTGGIRWVRFYVDQYSTIWDVNPSTGIITGVSTFNCN